MICSAFYDDIYIYICVYVYRRVYTEGRNQVKMCHAMSSMLGFLPQFLYPIYIHSSKYSINNTLNSTRSDKSYNLKAYSDGHSK